ncbi:MAG TPA: 3-dehydroquinate synthase [Clostridia bacterium]|nr:3-dehydroquinate synthase [Clostridia bacterium]
MKIACTQKKYNVLIGKDLLNKTGEILKEYFAPCAIVLVTDDRVDALYGDTVVKSLTKAGFKISKFVFPHGEHSKNLRTFSQLLEFMAKHSITRSDRVLALGGGVTGDLAGYAAACYMRGIGFVQMPTTLLAAVDSSVGGKTGVNLDAGKNLAGAFWQPDLVVCDSDTLNTLSDEILADGVAETIKYGMIKDAELFEKLETGDYLRDNPERCIARCVQIKGDVVARDEFDKGERQLLNFGHTLAHAIEKLSGYAITHGHAVAIGMVMVTRAAEKLNLTKEPCLDRLIDTLKKHGLPTDCPFELHDLTSAALGDKKRTGTSINLIIPIKIGQAQTMNLPVAQLESFIKSGLEQEG